MGSPSMREEPDCATITLGMAAVALGKGDDVFADVDRLLACCELQVLAAAPPKRVALAAGDDDSRPLAVSLKQGSGDIFVFGAPHDPTDQAAPDSPHTPLAAAAAAALSKLLTDQPAVAPAAAPTTPPSDAPAPTTAAASAYDSANTSGAAAPAAADEAALLASLAALWADEDRRERRRRSCAQHGGGASGSGSGDDEGDHSGGEETPLSCGELQLLNLLLRPDPAEGDTVTGLGGPQGDGVQLRPLWSMGLLPRTISGVRAKLRAKRHGCGSAACREAEPGVGAGARFGEAVMGEGRQDGEEQHQGEGVEEGEEGDEGGGPCLGCCAAAAAAAAPRARGGGAQPPSGGRQGEGRKGTGRAPQPPPEAAAVVRWGGDRDVLVQLPAQAAGAAAACGGARTAASVLRA